MRVLVLFLLIINIALSSEIRIISDNFYRGGLNIIKIKNWKGSVVEIITDKKRYTFPVAGEKSFFAIPFSSKNIVIINIIKNGRIIYREFIKIKDKKYPVSKIWVKERKLTKKLLQRIKSERKELSNILKNFSPKMFTENSFLIPVKNATISTPFGAKRIINGKKRSVHWGIDYKAPKGTPVFASLSGKVVLAKELFYTGKTVVIDHGLGLFTLYAHLSKINVKKGETVKGGQMIGKVGSTGRSTGPHLHFGIYLLGIRVDPALAFRLKL